jgi:hypothetical protein
MGNIRNIVPIGKFKFGESVGTALLPDPEDEVCHGDLVPGKTGNPLDVIPVTPVKKTETLGAEKTDYPVQDKFGKTLLLPQGCVNKNDIAPLDRLHGEAEVRQEPGNRKGKADEPIPLAEPRPHRIVLQNPHGKEKGGKRIVEDKKPQKPKHYPPDPVAFVLLFRVGIF